MDYEAYGDMLSFLYMLKCGVFPVTNISFQLFLDTVRWYSAGKKGERYRVASKDFLFYSSLHVLIVYGCHNWFPFFPVRLKFTPLPSSLNSYFKILRMNHKLLHISSHQGISHLRMKGVFIVLAISLNNSVNQFKI